MSEDRRERGEVWIEEGKLALRRSVKLPKVCLKCGATTNVERSQRTLYWIPPEKRRNQIFWGTLFGALGGALAGAAEGRHRRSITLELPICGRCTVGWRNSRIYLLLGVGAWFLLLFYLWTAKSWLGPWYTLGLFFAGLIALLVAARLLNRHWLVQADRIEKDYAVLARVPPQVCETILQRVQNRKAKRAE